MNLTDLKIKNLKLPNDSADQKTFFDDGLKGFGVRVSVGGSKSFVLMYGKRRKLKTLGRYPDISLADARVSARKWIGRVASLEEETDLGASSLPFLTAREEFLDDSKKRNKPATYEAYRRVLLKHFDFNKKIGAITRRDVMLVVDGLRNKPSESRHAFVSIRTLMNWAVLRGFIEHSPVPPIKYKVATRSRVLNDTELKTVWNRAVEVGYPYGTIVQLLILTGQRRGEIVGLMRQWIGEDEITFPIGFCKNKREHKIPIGSLTKQVLAAIPQEDEFLFLARDRENTTFSGFSKAKREFDEPLALAHYTLHDLRRTYSSNLARTGIPIHVTERLLNHVSGTVSGVAAVYNRYNYEPEMKQAVSAIAGFLAGLGISNI